MVAGNFTDNVDCRNWCCPLHGHVRSPIGQIPAVLKGVDAGPKTLGETRESLIRRATTANAKDTSLSKRKRQVSPLDYALTAIGDPWSFLVHQEAFFGVRRFGDFQRNLNIARNTLTDRLAMLVEFDLLERRKSPERPDIYEYRLSSRGLDTYPYALSLMKWGDDWLVDPDGPPVVLRHETCGKILRPLAVCAACRREVKPEDILINPSSVADSVRDDSAQVRYSSRPELYTAGRPSSVSRTLAAIGDRWGFFVLWLAFAGITKFDHFHRILGIARTTLAARLERMTAQGLLERVQYQIRPPRHDYHLTKKGRALCPVLLTLHDWASRSLRRQSREVPVLHKSCGKPLEVIVVCESCKQVALPKQVEVVKQATRKSTSRKQARSSSVSGVQNVARSRAR